MTRLTIVGRRFRVLALVLVGMQALATPGATAGMSRVRPRRRRWHWWPESP